MYVNSRETEAGANGITHPPFMVIRDTTYLLGHSQDYYFCLAYSIILSMIEGLGQNTHFNTTTSYRRPDAVILT